MINKKTASELKHLHDRLQGNGFSWQHSDYFLLKETLPTLILLILELGDRPLPEEE